MNSPFVKFVRVAVVGSAVAFWAQMIADTSGRVVWFMGPSEWCVGSNYVEARFNGYKFKDWPPVAGSFIGRAVRGDAASDVPFVFIDDPSPASSKTRGWRDFGVWRWYGSDLDRVKMVMQHQNPIGGQEGPRFVRSVYGFFDVPPDASACLGTDL